MNTELKKPYLLFLGNATDQRSLKMASSARFFIPEDVVGYCRLADCPFSYDDLPELDLEAATAAGARSFVLGLVNAGGYIDAAWIPSIEAAIRAGFDIVSGMHQRLDDCVASDGRRLWELAQDAGVSLHNLRHYADNLPVGTGKKRRGTRVLTVGTDCGSGKMFTAITLTRHLQRLGVSASFRATGQCGILVSGSGIAIDAVGADFISGAVETLSPDTDGVDIIEGQGSLFHPGFAGVSLGLLHGAQADYLILCHVAGREMIMGTDYPLPDIGACMQRNLEMARLTNPDVRFVGISVNTSALSEGDAVSYIQELEQKYGLVASDPHRFGVEKFVTAMGLSG